MMRRVSSPVLRGVGYGNVSFLPGRAVEGVTPSLTLIDTAPDADQAEVSF